MGKDSEVFLGLLRAGLWGRACGCETAGTDWKKVYLLARKQSVAPLVAEGIAVEKAAGNALDIEYKAMNFFLRDAYSAEKKNQELDRTLADISSLLWKNGIVPLQLKGQGYAREYLNPLRRKPGDIDFLFSGEDYSRASTLLSPLASKLETEFTGIKHFAMFFGDVETELHGTLHSHLSGRYNRTLDRMQEELFSKQDFRFYIDQDVKIAVPSLDFDAAFLFAHIVQHLYDFGPSMKQFCDWAVFLHAHHREIDIDLLQRRLKDLGILREWKALGCLVVDGLGLPEDEMPFFDASLRSKGKLLWEAMQQDSDAKADSGSKLTDKFRHLTSRLAWLSKIRSIAPSNTARAVGGIIFGGTATFLKGE